MSWPQIRSVEQIWWDAAHSPNGVYVFYSYSTELNWFSWFYRNSYKFILGFYIAVRKILVGFYKNICFGLQSTKAAFHMLACVLMVLEYCLIWSSLDTSWVGRVLEMDLRVISCGDEISFKTPESVVSSARGWTLTCIRMKMKDFSTRFYWDATASLMNRHGLVDWWFHINQV